VKENGMGMACSMHGREMYSYRILVEKPEEKRQLGRPKYWGEDNIKMDLIEICRCGMEWIYLTQNMAQWRLFLI
jgi:hypothetical protein